MFTLQSNVDAEDQDLSLMGGKDLQPTAQLGRAPIFEADLGDLPQSNSVDESGKQLPDDPATAHDPANGNIDFARHIIGLGAGTAEPGSTVANNHRVYRRDQRPEGRLIPMSRPTQ